jgi:hypothetical protein
MPGRRTRCPLLALIRQPGAGWMLVAMLYLTAAVLSVLLALSMNVWWPLALVAGSLVGGCACVTAALRARR